MHIKALRYPSSVSALQGYAITAGKQVNKASSTFAQTHIAALSVLLVAFTAVFVTGEGRTLHTATHLTSMLVPPDTRKKKNRQKNTSRCQSFTVEG